MLSLAPNIQLYHIRGVVDVVSLEKWIFNKKEHGKVFQRLQLDQEKDSDLIKVAEEKRQHLTDKLSGMDDKLANIVIEKDSLVVPTPLLLDSLRRVTINRKAVPILLGSSYKNIGVQPLMDAVVLYLPHPEQSILNNLYSCFKHNLAARVFKIVHHKHKGALAFTRIYNGNLKKGQKLYNIQRESSETCAKLYIVNADEYEEINEIGKGNIAAISGFKQTITGDLITTSASVMKDAKKAMMKSREEEEVEHFFRAGANIPEPVFFCSIEPPSLAYQTALDVALQQLEKEDPSLRVKIDQDTGQTVLAGMGELHIDIIKERIKSEYKIDVDLGELQISYRETINKTLKEEHDLQHEIGGVKHNIKVVMTIMHGYEGSTPEKPILLLDTSPSCIAHLKSIHPSVISAVKNGIGSAFINGPKIGCPVIDVAIKLHWLETSKKTMTSIISALIAECVKKMLKQCESTILEPIMDVEVVCDQNYSSSIISDLDRRRAEIKDIDIRGQNKIVRAFVPLSQLLGYATSLRISSSGNASFTMEFSHYQAMDSFTEKEAIKKVTGF